MMFRCILFTLLFLSILHANIFWLALSTTYSWNWWEFHSSACMWPWTKVLDKSKSWCNDDHQSYSSSPWKADMRVCTKFHGNPSNGRQDISLKTTTATRWRRKSHQNLSDNLIVNSLGEISKCLLGIVWMTETKTSHSPECLCQTNEYSVIII